ncbi:MAG: hypothetical protein ACKVWR_13370 [Acidimicrobiales bacterium]
MRPSVALTDGRPAAGRVPSRGRARALAALAAAALLGACGDEGDEAAFCAQVQNVPIPETLDQLSRPDPGAAMAPLITALTGLRREAPSRVRDDVTTMLRTAEHLRDALAARQTQAGGDGAQAALEQDLAGFRASSERVVAFARERCGVDLTAPR